MKYGRECQTDDNANETGAVKSTVGGRTNVQNARAWSTTSIACRCVELAPKLPSVLVQYECFTSHGIQTSGGEDSGSLNLKVLLFLITARTADDDSSALAWAENRLKIKHLERGGESKRTREHVEEMSLSQVLLTHWTLSCRETPWLYMYQDLGILTAGGNCCYVYVPVCGVLGVLYFTLHMSYIWTYGISRVLQLGSVCCVTKKIKHYTLCAKFLRQVLFRPVMLVGSLSMYHFVQPSLTLTLLEGHMGSRNQFLAKLSADRPEIELFCWSD